MKIKKYYGLKLKQNIKFGLIQIDLGNELDVSLFLGTINYGVFRFIKVGLVKRCDSTSGFPLRFSFWCLVADHLNSVALKFRGNH